ncbi:uncharacterized protein LOC134262451 [Saccostrea cucullata]|uniref:uncharacterized protein LOC134262451 n=1 Tax=Saccostrea cuccullata TaxID=36930 RepID=UPI002ED4DCBD
MATGGWPYLHPAKAPHQGLQLSDPLPLFQTFGRNPQQMGEEMKVFTNLFRTELNHAGHWECAKTTYLIYITNDGISTTIRNFNGKHAEITLIERLTERYVKKTEIPMHVDVYINNSPCKECASALIDYLGKCRQSYINIYFANLYNIRRKSCIEKTENHVQLVDKADSMENSNGLRMLLDHKRCTLQPFNKEAWKHLLMAHGFIENPQVFDQMYIYHARKEGDDRSRAEEDVLLEYDLEYIEKEEVLSTSDYITMGSRQYCIPQT